MRVMFATAELAPFVKVGGLADFSAGLVHALRDSAVDVEVILPDYGFLALREEKSEELTLPDWAGPGTVKQGSLDGFSSVSLVSLRRMIRPHPYVDQDGEGWPDNDLRFFSFSAAVAELVRRRPPDVLHLNDWHTGAVLGFLPTPPPSLLTIHNLAYQGNAGGEWLSVIPHRPEAYEWFGGVNPLTGAIALADRIVTVSPTFATEALQPETSFGLAGPLAARSDDFSGILNGIDTSVWDPETDPHLPINYNTATISRKRRIGRLLATELGWGVTTDPLIGMVSRLTGQKGIDIALQAVADIEGLEARMVLLGSGDRNLADAALALQKRFPDRFAFRSGHDERLAHLIFAASDIYLMPSRFEPAGLTQMQAMRYGSIPVVTDVGGLHDTVIDADASPESGNGFVAKSVTAAALAGALVRAVTAWRSTRRRGELRRRGMSHDWSWERPARRYHDLYQEIISGR